MKKIIISLLLSIGIFTAGCGQNQNVPSNYSANETDYDQFIQDDVLTNEPNNNSTANEKSSEDENLVFLGEGNEQSSDLENTFQNDNFQSDWSLGEENINVISKKAIEQGKWVYYCTDTEIKKMDTDGNVYTVLNNSYLQDLAVCGDWIYYRSEKNIGRVRTDGKYDEILVENMTASEGSRWGLCHNKLFYVEQYNISASQNGYKIHVYDTENKTDAESLQDGNIVVGLNNEFLYYKKTDDNGLYQYNLSTKEMNYFGNQSGNYGSNIYNDQCIKITSDGWGNTELTIINLNSDSIDYNVKINSGLDEGSFSRNMKFLGVIDSGEWIILSDYCIISAINIEKNKDLLPNSLLSATVVQENKSQISVYDGWVSGAHIYYMGDKGGTQYLYRIKPTGSDWEQLF